MTINTLHRKASIILTTIDVINEFGINSASTKEIAKRLEISEATVFKYFPKKNDLLYAVLENFSFYDNDIFRTTKLKKMGPKEAIIFYIDSYMSYYENYPAITAIDQAYDVLRGLPELESKVKSIFFNRIEVIRKMIEEAQEAGEIQRNADTESLADILVSTCRGICLRWRMNNFNFPLREKTLQAIKMLLNAFSPKTSEECDIYGKGTYRG